MGLILHACKRAKHKVLCWDWAWHEPPQLPLSLASLGKMIILGIESVCLQYVLCFRCIINNSPPPSLPATSPTVDNSGYFPPHLLHSTDHIPTLTLTERLSVSVSVVVYSGVVAGSLLWWGRLRLYMLVTTKVFAFRCCINYTKNKLKFFQDLCMEVFKFS